MGGVIYDRGVLTLKTRLRRFWKRGRRDGLLHLAGRVLGTVATRAVRPFRRQFDPEPIRRAIFPDEARSLPDLSARHGIPLVTVDSLNSEEAQGHLARMGADLGLVIGTRILKRQTFAIPRLGSVNVHKGKVPEYRGQPPAFWELYHGEKQAGVTIHMVEAKLDAGDVVREGSVPITATDTEHSVKLKLDELAADLLAEAVENIATGRATPRAQQPSAAPPFTTPTPAQRAALDRRLGTAPESALKQALKGAFYRFCLLAGPVWLRNAWLRLRRRTRCTVLLYHRVNDTSRDKLTTSVNRFLEHLALLRSRYPVVTLQEAREALAAGNYLGPNVVVITFDDGYADNYECAAPVLEHFRLPATFFVTAGLIGTPRPFAHDGRFPHHFRTLTWDQVEGLAACGFSIGSHGMTHANLARCPLEEARRDRRESGPDPAPPGCTGEVLRVSVRRSRGRDAHRDRRDPGRGLRADRVRLRRSESEPAGSEQRGPYRGERLLRHVGAPGRDRGDQPARVPARVGESRRAGFGGHAAPLRESAGLARTRGFDMKILHVFDHSPPVAGGYRYRAAAS